jgi:hypothetical protein
MAKNYNKLVDLVNKVQTKSEARFVIGFLLDKFAAPEARSYIQESSLSNKQSFEKITFRTAGNMLNFLTPRKNRISSESER